jgi:hypothetical protein
MSGDHNMHCSGNQPSLVERLRTVWPDWSLRPTTSEDRKCVIEIQRLKADAADEIERLTTERDMLVVDVDRCYKMLLSEANVKTALFEAENILRGALAKVKK